MKLTLNSLFLKIFFWFWATLIATAVALILTFILVPRSAPVQWRMALVESARNPGMVAVEMLERDGPTATSAYIDRLTRETQLPSCLFTMTGDPIVGRSCESFRSMASRAATSRGPEFSMRYGIARIALPVRGMSRFQYIYATELPEGPRFLFGTNRTAVLRGWAVALLVSGFICYLLTRYITKPIVHLRGVSQQLAAGDLSTRAATSIELRHDELGDLVHDFNAMAAHIEELVSSQRHLVSDVSHELRSPLARLTVALDLARKRKGEDSAFDHMERDLGLLNEMIERLLTVARLDTTSAPVDIQPLDLTELVERVVHDASFETQDQPGRVSFNTHQEILVRGNEALLHSAVENIVRNAICYGSSSEPVEVTLQHDANNASSVRLTVRDFGSGVPESELTKIFKPFYRVTAARDRNSGGAGLGLAIADRIVRIHHGTIRAENAEPHGLKVEITLPGLAADPSASTSKSL